jgi:hypothetical protein
MNHVIAKVKGRAPKTIFKLLSDKSLFDLDGIGSSLVPYEPDHNLDEDAWFKVEQFSQKPFCLDFLKQDFVSSEYDDLASEKFHKIAYLCGIQGNNCCFQKVTPSLFIQKKVIKFGEVAELEEGGRRKLAVNAQPDAIYQKSKDHLIFRSLATISSIFKGIDQLYKEATKEEVEQFLNEPFIALADGYDLSRVSKPNRKRISLAMNSLAELDNEQKKEMLTYIHSYSDETLPFDSKAHQFTVSTDDELKLLLYGIEQRFYTTPLSHEKRLANSVQTL